jgi:DNA-binding MarR family transcriptional regulator
MSSANFRATENSSKIPPRVGALLRFAWEKVREQIYKGVCQDGFDDLNPAHVALFRYEGLEGKRPSQLTEQMQITKQSIHELLRHLESCGYIEFCTDTNDKRARLINLTSRGRKLGAAVQKYADAAEFELEEQLGSKRFREFLATLQLISGGADHSG